MDMGQMLDFWIIDKTCTNAAQDRTKPYFRESSRMTSTGQIDYQRRYTEDRHEIGHVLINLNISSNRPISLVETHC
ncbi:hypothetical protein C6T56_22890 [Burkholderia multivorans]|nr:hypothetical protein C6P86_16245 [Burkholderia multivorans]PRE78365.1 hypothetical protein C6Q00_25050 [Burkholderia multivorans]PRG19383.1 hypothetical protein C6T57_21185 [Burkholderia multivorans]PRH15746.1 hypothetical protein C6T56_22890 [Burkholderia multivorans]